MSTHEPTKIFHKDQVSIDAAIAAAQLYIDAYFADLADLAALKPIPKSYELKYLMEARDRAESADFVITVLQTEQTVEAMVAKLNEETKQRYDDDRGTEYFIPLSITIARLRPLYSPEA